MKITTSFASILLLAPSITATSVDVNTTSRLGKHPQVFLHLRRTLPQETIKDDDVSLFDRDAWDKSTGTIGEATNALSGFAGFMETAGDVGAVC